MNHQEASRTFTTNDGTHTLHLRRVDREFGVPSYVMALDGRGEEWIDSALYDRLLSFSDAQLAHHFFG